MVFSVLFDGETLDLSVHLGPSVHTLQMDIDFGDFGIYPSLWTYRYNCLPTFDSHSLF